MKKVVVIGFASLFFFASCNNEVKITEAKAFGLDSVKAAIAQSNKTYGDGFMKKDSSLFISNYTTDGCIMPANAPKLCGKDGLAAFFKVGQSMGVNNIVLITEEVMGGPEAVVETGTYNLLGKDGKSFDNGKFIVVWKNEDGKWKMHRDIFTTNVAPAKK